MEGSDNNPAYRFKSARYSVDTPEMPRISGVAKFETPQVEDLSLANRAWKERATYHPDFRGFNPTLSNRPGSYVQAQFSQLQ